jgi:hypothetical protein
MYNMASEMLYSHPTGNMGMRKNPSQEESKLFINLMDQVDGKEHEKIKIR